MSSMLQFSNPSSSSPPSSFSFYQQHKPQVVPHTQIHHKAMEIREVEENKRSAESSSVITVEKEHMFDKVVTPSDVGKLNRLVIPKQHAEKYFPLDSSSNEKGLLLNFEDRTGKEWRFRYSYWNSSQSYVMTKGWSRFVKDKKLDAGDIVSFQRGVDDKDRFYIDWRRRPNHHNHHHHHGHSLFSVPWSPLLMRPPTAPYDLARNHFFLSNNSMRSGYLSYRPGFNANTSGIGMVQWPGEERGLVYESVPVVQGKVAAKRLRLFGVNMDCSLTESDHHTSSSSIITRPSNSHLAVPVTQQQQHQHQHQHQHQFRLYNGTPISPTQWSLYKGKSSSSSSNLSFDLHI